EFVEGAARSAGGHHERRVERFHAGGERSTGVGRIERNAVEIAEHRFGRIRSPAVAARGRHESSRRGWQNEPGTVRSRNSLFFRWYSAYVRKSPPRPPEILSR